MVAISVEASAIGIQLLIICLIEIKKWASALSYFTQTANEKISRLRISLIIQDLWKAMCLFTLVVGFRCTPTETEINSPVFPKCNQTNFDLNRLPLKQLRILSAGCDEIANRKLVSALICLIQFIHVHSRSVEGNIQSSVTPIFPALQRHLVIT